MPLLGACGFDYATDRPNTISAGVSDRRGTVDVLGAVVIAGQDDVGLFVATLVNKDQDEAITFDGVDTGGEIQPLTQDAGTSGTGGTGGTPAPTEGASDSTGSDAAGSISIPAGGRVSLFQTGGVPVTGTFGVGDFVTVTLKFSNGQMTTIQPNVLAPCRQYSLDKLTELTLPTLPPTASATPAPADAESAAAGEIDSASASASAEAAGDADTGKYDCGVHEPVQGFRDVVKDPETDSPSGDASAEPSE